MRLAAGKSQTPHFNRKIFDKATRHVYNQGRYDGSMLADRPVVNLIEETNRVFGKAIDHGIRDNQPPAEMMDKLRSDVFVFSACKTHIELKELSQKLITESGKIASWNDFRKSAGILYKTYNESYLQAEYEFATASAQMAAKWADISRDQDRYNLQYRTAGDDRVRDAHDKLRGTTLPASDPFWESYYPPNGWRCRCTVVQVLKDKYPVSDSAKAIEAGDKATTQLDRQGRNRAEIFRFNPGKQKIIFPPHHPYRKVQDLIRDILSVLPRNAGWEKIKTRKGVVRVSPKHGTDERGDNITTAKYLAETHGYEINLMPVVHEGKSADSYNVTLGVPQEYKLNFKPTKSAVDNEIRDAAKQADHIVIRVTSSITDADLERGIKGRVKQTQNVKSITIIRNNRDRTFSRDEILSKKFRI